MSIEEFGKWIIDLGDGKLKTYSLKNESDPTWIKVPTKFLIQHDVIGILSKVFDIEDFGIKPGRAKPFFKKDICLTNKRL
ncbi:hypothetical protein RJ639_005055 [Escallonia herrerae]|uniref:Uncharacterized protein n=1 Tax=Escallonia herrerae TaxID=1293975 RepID=A0AA88W2N4_9ASTE|nr:hypothetical protein RJ639_005055 [Escallonia herrerae]